MPVFALRLAYDGGDYAGWAEQDGRLTVADEVAAACARLGEAAPAVQGASRTDAGVHARGQVARVTLARFTDPAEVARSLARQLPSDVVCTGVAAVGDAFDPVRNAGKTYSYTIDNGVIGDPFLRGVRWRPPFRLDVGALNQVAALIPGRRDWQAFARRGETRTDAVRTIHACAWAAVGNTLVCTVSGDGFTYRLVRSLVGAMVAVAHGSCPLDDVARALAGETTAAAQQQAPAQGLCLERITYVPEPDWVETDGAAT
jgi:tRNA pseudouridine38-40 synthase